MKRFGKFYVIDEIMSEEDTENTSTQNESTSSSNSDIPDEEIEQMLDEALEEGRKNTENKENVNDISKVLLVERSSHDKLGVLPIGWVTATHKSGWEIYAHGTSRVCTLSKPYYLGAASLERHRIPLGAIPCHNHADDKLKESDDSETTSQNSDINTSLV